jgi:hypothetical protein
VTTGLTEPLALMVVTTSPLRNRRRYIAHRCRPEREPVDRRTENNHHRRDKQAALFPIEVPDGRRDANSGRAYARTLFGDEKSQSRMLGAIRKSHENDFHASRATRQPRALTFFADIRLSTGFRSRR